MLRNRFNTLLPPSLEFRISFVLRPYRVRTRFAPSHDDGWAAIESGRDSKGVRVRYVLGQSSHAGVGFVNSGNPWIG
jgi:hypothetical protein